MFEKGLFALSGDPCHLGHLDIISQIIKKAENIVVYITDNDEKRGSYLFSQEERIELLVNSFGGNLPPNVEIKGGNLPLVDMYLKEGCDVLFRGIRNEKDIAYENLQMSYHKRIYDINVEYVQSQYPHISSTVVKSFAFHHIDVSDMVPTIVKASLERRMHGQYLVGVTGTIGSGKSWVVDSLAAKFNDMGISAHVIKFDDLIRGLYKEESAGAQKARNEINELFPSNILVDGKINIPMLKQALVDFPNALKDIERITKPHVWRLYRETLKGKKGLIIVEWARLVEDNLTKLTNNVVVVVSSPNREEFLSTRNYTPEVRAVLDTGLSSEEKMKFIKDTIRESHYGKYGKAISYVNVKGQSIDPLVSKIVTLYPSLIGKSV